MKRIMLLCAAMAAMVAITACKNTETKGETDPVATDESLLTGKWDFAYVISDVKNYSDDSRLYETTGPDRFPLKSIEFTKEGMSIYTAINNGFDGTDSHDTIITKSCQYSLSNNILSVITHENGLKDTTEIIRLDADTLVLYTHSQTDKFCAKDTLFLVRHK